MTTIAGAAANRVLDKVGTLTPGKEADIAVLDARNINLWPMNNVPGTIVTMMNPRHVRDVMIAGKIVCWKGKLVGWNVDLKQQLATFALGDVPQLPVPFARLHLCAIPSRLRAMRLRRLRPLADEVRGVVRAARACVLGSLRVRTEGTRAIGDPVRHV